MSALVRRIADFVGQWRPLNLNRPRRCSGFGLIILEPAGKGSSAAAGSAEGDLYQCVSALAGPDAAIMKIESSNVNPRRIIVFIMGVSPQRVPGLRSTPMERNDEFAE